MSGEGWPLPVWLANLMTRQPSSRVLAAVPMLYYASCWPTAFRFRLQAVYSAGLTSVLCAAAARHRPELLVKEFRNIAIALKMSNLALQVGFQRRRSALVLPWTHHSALLTWPNTDKRSLPPDPLNRYRVLYYAASTVGHRTNGCTHAQVHLS